MSLCRAAHCLYSEMERKSLERESGKSGMEGTGKGKRTEVEGGLHRTTTSAQNQGILVTRASCWLPQKQGMGVSFSHVVNFS